MHILDWDDFIAGAAAALPLNLAIGVFDGVHRGHQALIREICASAVTPALVTFRQNPLQTLKPQAFAGDIYSLERKIELFSSLGVKMTVLIDFSEKFSKLGGAEFVSLLLRGCRMERLVLGRNFRCGYGLDTDITRIRELAGAALNITAIDPVTEGAGPVSSSRIRAAIAVGDFGEAALLMGRNAEIDLAGLPSKLSVGSEGQCTVFAAATAKRILPPSGGYRVRAYGASESGVPQKIEMTVSVENGDVIVPVLNDGKFNPLRLEFVSGSSRQELSHCTQ